MNKTATTVVILFIALVLIAIAGVGAYVAFFSSSPVSVELINSNNGADVTKNPYIFTNMPKSELIANITNMAKFGTPVVKFGDGSAPVTVVISGVHGDQLSPQIASLKLVDYLECEKIRGTVYVIPFAIPSSTSLNQKAWNRENPNKIADISGTPTNDLVNFVEIVGANASGDFHSSKPGGDPGVETIMCTQYPVYDSYLLALDIVKVSKDFPLNYYIAGWFYDGAVEDTLNLRGIPSVTGISVSQHGIVTQSAVNTSFKQMLGLLKANGNL